MSTPINWRHDSFPAPGFRHIASNVPLRNGRALLLIVVNEAENVQPNVPNVVLAQSQHPHESSGFFNPRARNENPNNTASGNVTAYNATTRTVTVNTTLVANRFNGGTFRITGGTGAGQSIAVGSNTSSTITLSTAPATAPTSSSAFTVTSPNQNNELGSPRQEFNELDRFESFTGRKSGYVKFSVSHNTIATWQDAYQRAIWFPGGFGDPFNPGTTIIDQFNTLAARDPFRTGHVGVLHGLTLGVLGANNVPEFTVDQIANNMEMHEFAANLWRQARAADPIRGFDAPLIRLGWEFDHRGYPWSSRRVRAADGGYSGTETNVARVNRSLEYYANAWVRAANVLWAPDVCPNARLSFETAGSGWIQCDPSVAGAMNWIGLTDATSWRNSIGYKALRYVFAAAATGTWANVTVDKLITNMLPGLTFYDTIASSEYRAGIVGDNHPTDTAANRRAHFNRNRRPKLDAFSNMLRGALADMGYGNRTLHGEVFEYGTQIGEKLGPFRTLTALDNPQWYEELFAWMRTNRDVIYGNTLFNYFPIAAGGGPFKLLPTTSSITRNGSTTVRNYRTNLAQEILGGALDSSDPQQWNSVLSLIPNSLEAYMAGVDSLFDTPQTFTRINTQVFDIAGSNIARRRVSIFMVRPTMNGFGEIRMTWSGQEQQTVQYSVCTLDSEDAWVNVNNIVNDVFSSQSAGRTVTLPQALAASSRPLSIMITTGTADTTVTAESATSGWTAQYNHNALKRAGRPRIDMFLTSDPQGAATAIADTNLSEQRIGVAWRNDTDTSGSWSWNGTNSGIGIGLEVTSQVAPPPNPTDFIPIATYDDKTTGGAERFTRPRGPWARYSALFGSANTSGAYPSSPQFASLWNGGSDVVGTGSISGNTDNVNSITPNLPVVRSASDMVLTSTGTSVDGTTFDFPITWVAGRLLMLSVVTVIASDTAQTPTVSIVSGDNPGTFLTPTYASGSSLLFPGNLRRMTHFYCVPSTSGSATIRFTTASTHDACGLIAWQADGILASAPIVQAYAAGANTANSYSIALPNATFGSSRNRVFAVAHCNNSTALSVEAGWSELSSMRNIVTNPVMQMELAWIDGQDPSATFSWSSTSINIQATIFEIAASNDAPPVEATVAHRVVVFDANGVAQQARVRVATPEGWQEVFDAVAVEVLEDGAGNEVPPVISGTNTVGSVLTVTSNGTWTSPSPTFGYQWRRNGTAIPGATASTYTVSTNDVIGGVGAVIDCLVTASAGGVSNSAASNGIDILDAPANITSPVISVQGGGEAITGVTLTATNGTWTSTPTSFTYRWIRNNSTIGTGQTYASSAPDAGSPITCEVSASNSSGQSTATSNSINLTLAGGPPASTVDPVITGNPYVNRTLTCSTGTWTSDTAITYAYQWFSGAAQITGATSATYVVSAAVEGTPISCRVTASNTSGSAQRSAAAVTAWTPDALETSLQGWWDASVDANFSIVGGAASAWADKSSYARNASQATNTLRPILDGETSNGAGLKALTFDGVNDRMVTPNNTPSPVSGLSVLVVASSSSTAALHLIGQRDGTGTGRGIVAINGGNIVTYVGGGVELVGPALGSGLRIFGTTISTDGQVAVHTPAASSAESQRIIEIANGPFTIGASKSDNQWWSGRVAEVIIVSGNMTTTLRQTIEGYLAHRWGLTALLPSGHPYKGAPPLI